MIRFLKNYLEVITGCKLYRNTLPRGVDLFMDIRRLQNKQIEEIWDIGAHKGETTIKFRSEFQSATIRSFEPISENFSLLIKNCSSLQKYHPYQFALGEENQTLKIYLQSNSVIHSLRDDLNLPYGQDSRSESVEVKTIDFLFSKFSCKQIDLLKIDVEGYEPQVLRGASSCLNNGLINFIYLENGLDSRFNSIEKLAEILSAFGYLPYGFYDQTAHWTGKQNLWYWNTLFVKEDLL